MTNITTAAAGIVYHDLNLLSTENEIGEEEIMIMTIQFRNLSLINYALGSCYFNNCNRDMFNMFQLIFLFVCLIGEATNIGSKERFGLT